MSWFRDEKECIYVAEKDSRQKNITQLTTFKEAYLYPSMQTILFEGGGVELMIWWMVFFVGKSRPNSWKVTYKFKKSKIANKYLEGSR